MGSKAEDENFPSQPDLLEETFLDGAPLENKLQQKLILVRKEMEVVNYLDQSINNCLDQSVNMLDVSSIEVIRCADPRFGAVHNSLNAKTKLSKDRLQ